MPGIARTAFVTGATGFVGRALVQKLIAADWSVTALVRATSVVPASWGNRVSLVYGDVGDRSACAKGAAGASCVFHLAAAVHDVAGGDDRRRQQSTTLEGTRTVLDAVATAGVPSFVFVSSLAVYGESGVVRSELDDCRPSTEYGRAKLAAEQLISSTSPAHLHWTILRPAMIYGIGAPGNLSLMTHLIRAHMLPALPRNIGRRSLVHVDDVARAALLTVGDVRAAGATFIVTDGQPMSLREIQDEIREYLGRMPHRYAIPSLPLAVAARLASGLGRLGSKRWKSISDWIERMLLPAEFDSTRIERELGFKPTTSLRRELPAIVAAFSNPSAAAAGEATPNPKTSSALSGQTK